MAMSDTEIRWALEIKRAVREEIDRGKDSSKNNQEADDCRFRRELSDFEYSQYALSTKGNLENALDRIEKMMYFQEEYNIIDTVEEGMALLEAFSKLMPWFLVSVEFAPEFGHFVSVLDYAKLNPKAVDFPADWRAWLGGFYYLLQLQHSNLSACRQGMVNICECEGMGYKNINVDFFYRTWSHLGEFYPHMYKEVSWLHTPLESNLLYASFKNIMGEFASIIQVGCHFSGYDGRIDEMFKVPSEADAKLRLDVQVESYLRVRYYHQSSFVLPEPTAEQQQEDEASSMMSSSAESDEDDNDSDGEEMM
ncbi:expressed unknown protein [Seminavis robusta]|uniref:Uncharacterized protein n=1 Tax=Seminavis robusta TaxID=568900 RepID=A0A9N8ELW6_9STRA|nr:expressed unknown protein [Seminavis robusta]|eukprot:Sro1195_g251370.1 n/a (308) ;mRNA; r:8284-9299